LRENRGLLALRLEAILSLLNWVRERVETRINDLLKKPAPKGWVEEKRIRGHIYLYYRWRDETGHVRSKYLGKPGSERAKALLAKIRETREDQEELRRLLRLRKEIDNVFMEAKRLRDRAISLICAIEERPLEEVWDEFIAEILNKVVP